MRVPSAIFAPMLQHLLLLLLISACSSSPEYEPFSHYDDDRGPGEPFEVKEVGPRVDRRVRDQRVLTDLSDGGDVIALEVGAEVDQGIDTGAPEESGVEDLAPLLPDADLSGCEVYRDCLLVVDLAACTPCPRAANRSQLEQYPCWVEYETFNALEGYDAPEERGCWGDCLETQEVCAQPHFDLLCELGQCIGVGGLNP